MKNKLESFLIKLKNKTKQLYNQRTISKIFPKNKIEPIVNFNRETLKKVNNWIDDEVYEESIYQYGLPQHARHLIDRDVGKYITYSDAILYLSSFLKKDVNYLELGVSVGKNFLQIINFLKNSNITGLDIEEINPILEKFFCKVKRIEWETMNGSMKRKNSSLTTYIYVPNNNRIMYISGDVFDENSWNQLSGNRYNIIFSDAFHTPEALLHEYQMIKKHSLIDEEEFILVWDDLHGEMESSFNQIWFDLSKKYNLKDNNKLRIGLNGWLGQNEFVHEIGIIMKFMD